MDNFLLNLLKVSAGTTLLYLCYLLFFSRDTFYLRNRIFLILALLLPLTIPVLRIPVLSTANAMAPTLNTFDSSGISETSFQPMMQAAVNSPDYNRLLIWLYLAITGFFLLKILVSLISTYRIIRKGTVENNNFPKVIISKDQLPPFSFFPFCCYP